MRDRVRSLALILATLAFACAALDVRIGRSRPTRVAVIVDASPATRGMTFRDGDRARELARHFAPGATLVDGADEADAVLLFGDPRDDRVPGVPTFPIVDPRDESTGDARLTDARVDGDRLLVTVTNDGGPRTLRWPDGATQRVGRGTFTLSHAGGGGRVTLDAGDRWPENDAIDAIAAPAAGERWWIGDGTPADYRAIAPRALPPIGEWLATRVVVLNDVPADAFDDRGREAVARYARDLGGAVVILGGPHAFSAGGYTTTALDAIGPLASVPPGPTRDWVVLVDASGSMASATGDGRSKLDVAAAAAGAIEVPPGERVVVASVAGDVRWWPTRDVPADLVARGPTNLASAIDAVIAQRRDRPTRLVIVSDGEATFADIDGLTARCRAARVSVDWLALPPGTGPVGGLVNATGGVRLDAGAAVDWRDRARQLARAGQALPIRRGVAIDAGALGAATLDVNGVFARAGIEPLATGAGQPLAATWRVGLGRVTGVAFAPPAAWRDAWVDRAQLVPRDPRFATTWTRDAVVVDAVDSSGPMYALSLELRHGETSTRLEPIAPGRYRAPLARDARPSVATIVDANGTRLDAAALPGSYPAAFDHVGLDRAALDRVARDSGGRVVDARERASIAELPAPFTPRSIRAAWLLAGIALCVGAVARR